MSIKNQIRFRVLVLLAGLVTFNWIAVAIALFAPIIQASNGTVGILWGSIAASAAGTFNITYVPQYIGFTITSAPTLFQINIQGDGVIFNLDATGITAMKNIRFVGAFANQYVFQLANGLINGKNGSVNITNAAAAQLDVYAWSQLPGNMYMTYLTQKALANSGIDLRKFAYAAFPSAGTADIFTLQYNSGITQQSYRQDLQYMLGYTQENVGSVYNFDNIAPAIIDTITYTPTTDQNVYVMQYQASRGAVQSAIVAKG